MSKPVLCLFLKAHVNAFTRSDGSVVQAHETKTAAASGDIGGGLWRKGHKAKLHVPGHPMHGREGTITGPGHKNLHVALKGKDGVTHSVDSSELRPAEGHSWPDLDGHQAKKKAPRKAPANLDPHPNVIGSGKDKGPGRMEFDGRTYVKTGKEGNSMHDGTLVHEYEHSDSGHRVWMDGKKRVHADSHEEAARYRKGR